MSHELSSTQLQTLFQSTLDDPTRPFVEKARVMRLLSESRPMTNYVVTIHATGRYFYDLIGRGDRFAQSQLTLLDHCLICNVTPECRVQLSADVYRKWMSAIGKDDVPPS